MQPLQLHVEHNDEREERDWSKSKGLLVEGPAAYLLEGDETPPALLWGDMELEDEF